MESSKGPEAAWHKKAVRAMWGIPAVIAVAVPGMMFFAYEAAPDEYRARFVAELPWNAAVRAEISPPPAGEEVPTEAASRTPAFVKGIYVTASSASDQRRFPELVQLVEETELNAMVIDIKDGNGRIAFVPEAESLKPHAAERSPLGDLKEFTTPLREKGIYLIARQVVFQDPYFVGARPDLAVQRAGGGIWRDFKGVPWLDPTAEEVWEYNVAIAKEAFRGGFDEIQLDYIRFPSDGQLSSMRFVHWDGSRSKADAMEEFFGYLDTELRVKQGIPTSVDLFGLTLWLHDTDLNIGQRLDKAIMHFDFVSPMVYPSHYPTGFLGFSNPAAYPYEIVYENLVKGQAVLDAAHEANARLLEQNPDAIPSRIATVRPWIQDFDLGADYTPARVRAQMKATEDGEGSGWLLWNARNVYTRDALGPPDGGTNGDATDTNDD